MRGKYMNRLTLFVALAFTPVLQAETLHQAIADRNIEAVKVHIQEGTDINQMGSYAIEGSALHVAVRSGQPDIARLLIESGAEVDIRDNSDFTPLHNAAWNGNLEMVKLLLDAGANITARDYSGFTPLACAYRSKQVDVIEYIKARLQSAAN
jgi:ankyrin repeat protein